MKNTLIIIGLGLLFIISISSCRKSRNCECTEIYTDGSAPSKYSFTYTGTKASAQTLCDANNYTNSYSITTCVLK